jgi:hypothetical protein
MSWRRYPPAICASPKRAIIPRHAFHDVRGQE